jgi:hypothetical protein
MAPKVMFDDYITPLKDILQEDPEYKDIVIRKLIYFSRKILHRHTSRKYTVDQAVDRLLDPNWLKRVKEFYPAEWKKLAEQTWKKAGKLLGQVPKPDIILYPSFGMSNGRVYRLGKQSVLAFSPDFRYCRGDNMKCLLAHEYGHFLRERITKVNTELQCIYKMLYEEGWAVYFSQLMFPELPSNVIYMSKLHKSINSPDPQGGYLRWCKKNIKLLAAEALNAVSSRSSKDMTRFFQCGRFDGDDTPIRVGYYLGSKIVEKLSEEMSTKELMMYKPSIKTIRIALNGLIK